VSEWGGHVPSNLAGLALWAGMGPEDDVFSEALRLDSRHTDACGSERLIPWSLTERCALAAERSEMTY
jgi:hypothetical protein